MNFVTLGIILFIYDKMWGTERIVVILLSRSAAIHILGVNTNHTKHM